jgi:predicted permease
MLRPLPFSHAASLYSLFESTKNGDYRLASYPTARDWLEQSAVLDGLAYVPGNQVAMHSPSGVELLTAAYPTGDFFRILGMPPLLGRVLTSEDDRRGERAVVLSYRAWQQLFANNPNVIGETLPLVDGPAVVVGVMPRGFRLPEWANLWMPFGAMPSSDRLVIEKRGNHADSRVLARLKPGVSADHATQVLSVIAGRLAATYPEEQRDWTRVALMSLDQYLAMMTAGSQYEDRKPRLLLFLAGAVLVLLVSAVTVGTLTVTRGLARGPELAVRAAIGASRLELVRELFAETAILAVIGSALGLWFATTAITLIQKASPDLVPRLFEVELDGRLSAIAAAIAVITTIGAGLWPAISATRRPPFEVLSAEGVRTSDAPQRRQIQRLLVLAQVAIATMLLIGAGVLLRSFRQVLDRPLGFKPDGLASVEIRPPPEKFPGPTETRALYGRLEQAVAGVPGVAAVAIRGGGLPSNVTIPGRNRNPDHPDNASFRTISPNYFRVMGIRFVEGDGFSDTDLAGPNGKLIINQAFARQFWPGQSALGRSLTIEKAARWLPDLGQPISGTVIGVIADVSEGEEDASPEVYVPYTWNLWRWIVLEIRAVDERVDPIRDPVRRAILAIDPDLPMAAIWGGLGVRTYDEQLTEGRAGRRLTTLIITAASAITLLLAALGLYAVVAYSVVRRRREIGIRLALGSDRRRIARLVLGDSFGSTMIGLGLGLLGGWYGVRLLRSLVYGIATRDPITFAVVPGVLMLAVLIAVVVPVYRATTLSPNEALRS